MAYLYDLPKQVNHLESLTFPQAMVREPVSMSASPSMSTGTCNSHDPLFRTPIPNSGCYSRSWLSILAAGELGVVSPIPRVPSLPSLRELGSTLAEGANRLTARKPHDIASLSTPTSRIPSPVGDMPAHHSVSSARGPSPRVLVDHYSDSPPPGMPRMPFLVLAHHSVCSVPEVLVGVGGLTDLR
jgi:hypothetical protein